MWAFCLDLVLCLPSTDSPSPRPLRPGVTLPPGALNMNTKDTTEVAGEYTVCGDPWFLDPCSPCPGSRCSQGFGSGPFALGRHRGVRGRPDRSPLFCFPLENSHHLKIFLPKKLLECLPRCPLLPPERLRWNTNEVLQGAWGEEDLARPGGLEEGQWGSSCVRAPHCTVLL